LTGGVDTALEDEDDEEEDEDDEEDEDEDWASAFFQQ
jgi:hypothetical protein